MDKESAIRNSIVRTANTRIKGTGFVLHKYKLIVTALHNVYGNKEVLINGTRFPRTTAKVLFVDPLYNLAFVEAPAGVIFPKLNLAENIPDETGKIMAISYLFDSDLNISFGNISDTDKEIDHKLLMTTNFDEKIYRGSALSDENGSIIGMNDVIVRQDEKITVAVPASYIKKSIEEYGAKGEKYAMRCSECKKISALADFSGNVCPHCGAKVAEALVQGIEYTPVPVVAKIEEIIKKLNYEIVISRIGKHYWEIEEGSALIRIKYDEEEGYIAANAILCRLPDKHMSNIYEYLLMENNYLKGLSFSIQNQNIVLSMMQIYKDDLHVHTAIKLFKYLFSKADDYDDILIEMGAQPLYDE